jgi:hypothetical protein
LGRKLLVYSDQKRMEDSHWCGLYDPFNQLHLCIRNAFFLWREKNMDLMDALDSGKDLLF